MGGLEQTKTAPCTMQGGWPHAVARLVQDQTATVLVHTMDQARKKGKHLRQQNTEKIPQRNPMRHQTTSHSSTQRLPPFSSCPRQAMKSQWAAAPSGRGVGAAAGGLPRSRLPRHRMAQTHKICPTSTQRRRPCTKTKKINIRQTNIWNPIFFVHIEPELPAKLLDYFLPGNKSNINQYLCWSFSAKESCTYYLICGKRPAR